MDDVKVVFTPSGKRGSFARGTSLLDAARALGVDLDSVCGGRGLCGRCQVQCSEGEFPKFGFSSDASHLSAFTATEQRYSERKKPLTGGRRLGCHTLLEGDVVIDVPPESQVHQQVVRKETDNRPIETDPLIRLHAVEVAEPLLDAPGGDYDRLIEALANDWQLAITECSPQVLKTLQPTLREGKWFVTAAVRNGNEILRLWPGLVEAAYGFSVDVGSTTVAATLSNLATGEVVSTASMMNPQIRFGEDLMSRVSYVMMNPDAADDLTEAIRTAIDRLIIETASTAEIDREDILDFVFVANPVMHHILLGINPIELGGAPFALAVSGAVDMTAANMDLKNANPAARVHVLPCIAGHVGADAAAMVLAEMPQASEKVTLLVDVGTNAEIVLGNSERLLAASSPTGPAFEGAQITCGQRAAPGAIERVRIDRDSLAVRFKVIGSDAWSDDPSFDHKVTGICGSGIIEVVAEMFLAGLINDDGVINGSLVETCPRLIQEDRTWSFMLHHQSDTVDGDVAVRITQNDIRQIQLAKAALYAGTRLLMAHFGADKVDRIRLAGAFGSQIDVTRAMAIGLIPDCEIDEVSSAGNAAGTGARIALLNGAARDEIQQVVHQIEKIETATEAAFQDEFVAAMAFPHKRDPFNNLFALFERPPVRKTDEPPTRRRRGRRRG